MLLNLFARRCSWVHRVLDALGLLAVAVNTDLAVLTYIFLGWSDQRPTQPTRIADRGAACFTSKAGAYRSVRGRELAL